MRIIAGRSKGHRLAAPRGRDTRPTADRVREAVYSAVVSRLGELDGRAVADLYAGSGALGLEALSRGAAHCVFVESDRNAASVIRANAASLGVDPTAVQVVQTTVAGFASHSPEQAGVSLLLADPPYRIDAAEFSQVLEALAGRGFLDVGALVVYEHSVEAEPAWPAGFVGEPARKYGSTAVSFATYEG